MGRRVFTVRQADGKPWLTNKPSRWQVLELIGSGHFMVVSEHEGRTAAFAEMRRLRLEQDSGALHG